MSTETVEAVSVESQDAMIRRLTSELAACHNESVRLLKVLLNVAQCLQLKKNDHYSTIKALKRWAVDQLEAQKLRPLI